MFLGLPAFRKSVATLVSRPIILLSSSIDISTIIKSLIWAHYIQKLRSSLSNLFSSVRLVDRNGNYMQAHNTALFEVQADSSVPIWIRHVCRPNGGNLKCPSSLRKHRNLLQVDNTHIEGILPDRGVAARTECSNTSVFLDGVRNLSELAIRTTNAKIVNSEIKLYHVLDENRESITTFSVGLLLLNVWLVFKAFHHILVSDSFYIVWILNKLINNYVENRSINKQLLLKLRVSKVVVLCLPDRTALFNEVLFLSISWLFAPILSM